MNSLRRSFHEYATDIISQLEQVDIILLFRSSPETIEYQLETILDNGVANKDLARELWSILLTTQQVLNELINQKQRMWQTIPGKILRKRILIVTSMVAIDLLCEREGSPIGSIRPVEKLIHAPLELLEILQGGYNEMQSQFQFKYNSAIIGT